MTEYNPSPDDIHAYQRRQKNIEGWAQHTYASSISSRTNSRSGTPQAYGALPIRYGEPLIIARSTSYNDSASSIGRSVSGQHDAHHAHHGHVPHFAAPLTQRPGSPDSFNGYPPGHFGYGADATTNLGGYGGGGASVGGGPAGSEAHFAPMGAAPASHYHSAHSRAGSARSRTRSDANGLKSGSAVGGGSHYAGTHPASAVPEVLRTGTKYSASPHPRAFPGISPENPYGSGSVPGSPTLSSSSLLHPPFGAPASHRSAKPASLRSTRSRYHSSRSPAASLAPLHIPGPSYSNNGDAEQPLALVPYTPTARGGDDGMVMIPGSVSGGSRRPLSKAKSQLALSSSSSSRHAYGYGQEYHGQAYGVGYGPGVPPVPAMPAISSHDIAKGVNLTTVSAPNGRIAANFLVTAPGVKINVLSGSDSSKSKEKGTKISTGGAPVIHIQQPRASKGSGSAKGGSRIEEVKDDYSEEKKKGKGGLAGLFSKKK